MRRRSVRGLTVTESPFKLDSGAIVRAATTPPNNPLFSTAKAQSTAACFFLCTSASSSPAPPPPAAPNLTFAAFCSARARTWLWQQPKSGREVGARKT